MRNSIAVLAVDTTLNTTKPETNWLYNLHISEGNKHAPVYAHLQPKRKGHDVIVSSYGNVFGALGDSVRLTDDGNRTTRFGFNLGAEFTVANIIKPSEVSTLGLGKVKLYVVK